jgi:hypothetical protein
LDRLLASTAVTARKVHVTLTEKEADALLDLALEGLADAEARFLPGEGIAYAAGNRAINKIIAARDRRST